LSIYADLTEEIAMPVYSPEDANEFAMHGSTFRSVVAPSRGSVELCAWELVVAAGSAGAAHRPTREEVLRVLDGDLRITLDGQSERIGVGAVVLVPAGAQLRVDGGQADAHVWVTTTAGLQATTSDGETISPPWAN
jgi:mannose-6-phosphate isomerase-like protein (cupin superfamily)